MTTSSYFKMLAFRFVRGFIAGAIGTMVPIVTDAAKSHELALLAWLNVLAVAAVVGGITGAILALDKYVRFEEKEVE